MIGWEANFEPELEFDGEIAIMYRTLLCETVNGQKQICQLEKHGREREGGKREQTSRGKSPRVFRKLRRSLTAQLLKPRDAATLHACSTRWQGNEKSDQRNKIVLIKPVKESILHQVCSLSRWFFERAVQ